MDLSGNCLVARILWEKSRIFWEKMEITEKKMEITEKVRGIPPFLEEI